MQLARTSMAIAIVLVTTLAARSSLAYGVPGLNGETSRGRQPARATTDGKRSAPSKAAAGAQSGDAGEAPEGATPMPAANVARLAVQTKVVDKLALITSEDAVFFEQLELSIAGRAFDSMQAGAYRMIDSEGEIVQPEIDVFHNFTDEFLRAMSQFESGQLPRSNDYGMAAKDRAKQLANPMSLAELKKVARRIVKDVTALKAAVNKTPGMEDVASTDASKLSTAEFVIYTKRVVALGDVLTGNVGLGPVFSPAVSEADWFRTSMVKLAQAANGLVGPEGDAADAAWKTYEEWLKDSTEAAKQLGRKAPAWKDPLLGNRGPKALAEIERLTKIYQGVKARHKKP